MKIVERKKILRLRIMYNPRNEIEAKSVMNELNKTFGVGRFVYSIVDTQNPTQSLLTAESI